MTAFVTFIKTYAIWIFLLSGIGILVGVKMLYDARVLARTTLFSLDQERAGEQYYRGIVLIVVLILLACAVLGINLFVSPAMPAPEPPVVRQPTPTVNITISPSSPIPPTNIATLIKSTETIGIANPSPVVVSASRTPTKPPPTPIPATATPFALLAPIVKGPVPNGGAWYGSNQDVNNIVFRWEWNCGQCTLGLGDFFFVSVFFVDRNTGAPRMVAGTSRTNFLSLRTIADGSGAEIWHQAKDDHYSWNVQVKRGDQPLSPPSETWKFDWH